MIQVRVPPTVLAVGRDDRQMQGNGMSTTEADRKYLRWWARRGPADYNDWAWLNRKFLPAIGRFQAAARSAADKGLLSDCYYKVGDVFYFMDAPLESLKYYKLSIKADPEQAAAYREAGDRLEEIGKYEQARRYLTRSLELWPDDELARRDLEFVVQDLKYDSVPLYEAGDRNWAIDELLARGKFKKVLSKLATPEKVEDRQRRASAHGGMGETKAFIAEWDKIAEMDGPVEFRRTDWFYMPGRVWNSTAFWLALRTLAGRLRYGAWPSFDSLWTSVVPAPKRRRIGSKADIERYRRRCALVVEYHIARTSRDAELSGKLAGAYPDWPEVQKLHMWLASR